MQHRVRSGLAGTSATVVLLLTVSGCGAPAGPAGSGDDIGAEEAEAIAREVSGGGRVETVEIDDSSGATRVWEVTLVAPDGERREITIDPADGTVLGDEPDD